jgi:hypothetical protein
MATSSRLTSWRLSAVAVAVVLGAIAVWLATAWSSPGSRVAARGARAAAPPSAGVFSWLVPTVAPKTWTRATIASGGATLFYPPNFTRIPGDRGTVTAALRDSAGHYLGYLNVTPREGAERLAGWAAFRKTRSIDEGDTQVQVLAAGEHLRFANASGSCVIDDYHSRVGSHPYREIACIVAGSRSTSVLVAATLVSDWPTYGSVIERAASAFSEH